MKITVKGSTGNISKPLTQKLIAAGHTVTVVSSNADKAAEIEALGAIPAIGNITDVDFLTTAFSGADAIYTMVPPNFGATNLRAYMNQAGEAYAQAIKNADVKKVVQLSSIGAHLGEGVGPIKGIHDVEGILSKLDGVNIKFVRAPFFYTNFYGNVDMIKHAGILGNNYPADARLIMVHPKDIADVIFEELQNNFEGKSIRYLYSDESTPAGAAKAIGQAIGKPELPWVEFNDEQALAGLLQAGIPEEMSKNFVEMGTAVRSGAIWEDFDAHKPAQKSAISLETFAEEFASRF
ncbi:NAD(P)H-binding protein [Mucilaginibacter pedocola]|uniref:NAD-dependent dehydratase n=1 Tax=Mucilaginibacter pedocola TaxID=1792845 RepID=A0A1S9PKG8_9SPHI|nr:NAD(P)H-binding protein [Mucilaginibacter pedocola]OOQ61444.1 NAD-dependent dehydratase [Mucilaginibacter pedocola]